MCLRAGQVHSRGQSRHTAYCTYYSKHPCRRYPGQGCSRQPGTAHMADTHSRGIAGTQGRGAYGKQLGGSSMSTQAPDSIEWWYCSNSHCGGDKRGIIIGDGPTRVVIHSNLCAGIRLGTLPAAEVLQGVRRMSAPPPLIQDTNRVPAATQSMSEVATLVTSQSMSSSAAPISTVATAPGLPLLAKKLAESILAGNYVDFAELPPAKGCCKLLQSTEGQLVLIHAADLLQSKRLIPDLATWCQCFAIFAADVTSRHPERTASLMAYLAAITKASTRYKWTSWIVYDLNYRQNAADTGQTD